MAPGSHARLAPRPDLPLSRPIRVDDVPETGLEVEVSASEAERAAIAADTGLPGLGKLVATFTVERRGGGGRYEVSGTLDASITQICVVTLEPFDSDITQEIDLAFAPAPAPAEGSKGDRVSRRHTDARPARTPAPPPPAVLGGEEDPPDPIVDGIIDLGAVAVEFLMLGRDLYPRRPGVAFDEVSVGDDEAPDPSPFAALQRLKDKP